MGQIRLQGIRKSFGALEVLKGIDLDIAEGEFVQLRKPCSLEDLISALHKSIRGSDPQAALYYLARMLTAGEEPLFVLRRLIRAAIEDRDGSTSHRRRVLVPESAHGTNPATAALIGFKVKSVPARPDGTVAVGSTSERDVADTTTDAQLDALIARAQAICPALAGAEVIDRWAGVRPRALSRAPLVGAWPGRPGRTVPGRDADRWARGLLRPGRQALSA